MSCRLSGFQQDAVRRQCFVIFDFQNVSDFYILELNVFEGHTVRSQPLVDDPVDVLVIVQLLKFNDSFFYKSKHDYDCEWYNSRNRHVSGNVRDRLQHSIASIEDVHNSRELQENGHWEES